MRRFGHLEVRLDPWQTDYGSEIPLELEDEAEEDAGVNLDIEMPASQWQPITPDEEQPNPQAIFVDGVRRIEARLVVRHDERVCHGAFGSYAVGFVAVNNRIARIGEPHIGRIIAVGSGEQLDLSVVVGPGVEYRPLSTVNSEPDGPLRAIQEQMRLAEERLSKELADADDALVIADGPLTFEEPVRGTAIGYIKRLFKLYLPVQYVELLARLQAGQRTPLFALRSSHRFARYCWFLRLAAPALGDSDLSGIVRLEVAEYIGSDRARQLANRSAGMLPRFAPHRWRDPRSPQNLLPIGGLEQQLRHRLGDMRLIRRRIQTLLAEEAQNV